MCTVTLVARRHGYLLGMNRDEKLTRVRARPPSVARIGQRTVLLPSEPGGGTWIGVNDSGATIALINWYSVPGRVDGRAFSRGQVARSALAANTAEGVNRVLAGLPIERVNPFRLIGVFGASRTVVEWRWDLRRLEQRRHPWKTQTWISSGFDEPGAERTRGATFRAALRQRSSGRQDWLRRLHRSHRPRRGAYSTCMHRDDAATVSYTEVLVASPRVVLRYLDGSPCRRRSAVVRRLRRASHGPAAVKG